MEKLVLRGHGLDEYRDMFCLSAADLAGNLLEYGCGATAVNQEQHAKGCSMVSCDSLFALDAQALTKQVTVDFDAAVARLSKSKALYDFSACGGMDAVVSRRRGEIKKFLDDYALGRREGRYLAITDEALPFDDFSFDLVLSARFLFSEVANSSVDFHVQTIKELARVGKEVRIFPLIADDGEPSPVLGPVLLALQQENYGTEVKDVRYALQPKGNAMLRVWAQQCVVE